MSRYRDEAAEMEHLEGPEFLEMGALSGGSSSAGSLPPHHWARADFGERCPRCHVERFESVSRRRGVEWLYRLTTGQLRMGAEPRCARKAKS